MTFSSGTDDDQHAFPVVVTADVEINAVYPPVDVLLIGEVPLGPLCMFFAPPNPHHASVLRARWRLTGQGL